MNTMTLESTDRILTGRARSGAGLSGHLADHGALVHPARQGSGVASGDASGRRRLRPVRPRWRRLPVGHEVAVARAGGPQIDGGRQRHGGRAGQRQGPCAAGRCTPSCPGRRRGRGSGGRRLRDRRSVSPTTPNPRPSAIETAIAERRRSGTARVRVTLQRPPGRYVSGEESALVGWLDKGPRPSRPASRQVGPARRAGVDPSWSTTPRRWPRWLSSPGMAPTGSGAWERRTLPGPHWSPSADRFASPGSSKWSWARRWPTSSTGPVSSVPCRPSWSVGTEEPGSTPAGWPRPTRRLRWLPPEPRPEWASSSPSRRHRAAWPRRPGWSGTWPARAPASAAPVSSAYPPSPTTSSSCGSGRADPDALARIERRAGQIDGRGRVSPSRWGGTAGEERHDRVRR